MNDSDIQLIVSLIDGQLSAAEEEEAFSRMQTEAELRTAYEQQLAVSTKLRSVPAASMSAGELGELHAALRAELRLEDAEVAPAATAAAASGWRRWWAPLAGLATAAVVVLAFVVVPNLGDDETLSEVGVALETTAPSTLAADRLEGVAEDLIVTESEGQAVAPSTTAAAAFEESPAPDAMQFALTAPEDATTELEVPVLGDEIEVADVEAATRSATKQATVDYASAAACFGSSGEELGEADIVGSVTQTGDEVVVVLTDTSTGEETVLIINLATCEVTSAG